MDALEELRRNREARVNQIQKGFASYEMDIQKAQVGERRTFQGKEYVWIEFAPGKFGWRRPKDGHAAAPQHAPQPKQAAPKQEPDFTPKIPQEISRLNNRSDYDAFDAAYDAIGADLFTEKYPTTAAQQQAVANSIYTKEQLIRRMGRVYAGDIDDASKTTQISRMKSYYEEKAKAAKDAHQKAKNEAYWEGEGAKRKADIMKRRDELKDRITRNIEGAKKEIQSLVATSVPDGPFKSKMIPTEVSFVVNYNDERITIQETTDTGNRYNSGIEITITHGDSWVKTGDKGYDEVGTAEISMSSMRTKEAESVDWEHERNKMMLANTTMSQMGKIKKTLVGYVSGIREARDEIKKLDEELAKNH